MSADLMLDLDNDLSFTPLGDIATITDDQELVQMAINNLSTIYGEYFLDSERGNKAFTRRMKLTASALSSMEYDCRVAILQDIRVIEVPSVTITRAGLYSVIIDFTLRDRSGRIINATTQLSM